MREMREHPCGQDKGRARRNATIDYQDRSSTRPSLLHQMLSQVWAKQLEEDDLELLDVSLYHLFHNLDLLLQEILPQLAEIAVQEEANTHYTYGSCNRQILRQHIWVWLSEMKNRLERIDPLCQITAITISHLLIAIDTSRSTTLQKSRQQLLFTHTYQYKQQVRPLTTDERIYYTQELQIWQELSAPPRKIAAFEQLFSEVQGSHIYLGEMDTTLTKIYCNAKTIFNMTLHASKTTANPKETIHLLLDLQQHISILQKHIETFLTPLYILIKHYALLVELR